MNDVKANYIKANENGINVRGMVVINPGNPTGQILTKINMEQVCV